MLSRQLTFFNDDPYLTVPNMSIEDRTKRAVELLQAHEPDDGYYLAFSGGKDSCVCKKLLQLSGCKFDAWYNVTTIDPPELVYFIKKYHSDVQWSKSKYGNMMHRVATKPNVPPSRYSRWCCAEFKEYGGQGRTVSFGVRIWESASRKANWSELSVTQNEDPAVCPIAFWTDAQVWEFIKFYQVPYCSLYDEGFKRLGCIGCPLASQNYRDIEFARWPNFERNWKRAIIANWERWHDVPNTRTGKPRYHARFKTGEEFWRAWRFGEYNEPDYIRGACQPMLLWTNEPGFSDDEESGLRR